MSTDGVLGAAWLPTDGYLDPSQLTFALAEGAREGGVQIFTSTRVTGIEQGRVRTERGDIDAEVVVIAGGMFSAELGRLAGVRIPVVPDVARVHRDPAVPRARSAEPAADAARPRPAHLLPRGGRRARDGRLRASRRAGLHAAGRRGFRAHPARLQRPPARGRLGPLRGDRRELAPARAADGGREGHAHDQRAGGIHARQRVLPRRDGACPACSWRAASAHTASRARAAWAR